MDNEVFANDSQTKPVITYRDCETNRQYEVLNSLARGRYGDVHKCALIANDTESDNNDNNKENESKTNEKAKDEQGNIYALKAQEVFNGEITNKLQREIDIMLKLNKHKSKENEASQHVIELVSYFVDSDCLLFVLPYFETDLGALLTQQAPFHLDLIRNTTQQILCAISFMHSLNVLHRDIKPNNVLCSHYNAQTHEIKVVLTDFGSARDITDILEDDKKFNINDEFKQKEKEEIMQRFEDPEWSGFDTEFNCKLSPQIYVPQYRAPELVLGERYYRFPVDVWPVGCMMAQMTRERGSLLFTSDHDLPLFMEQMKVLGGPLDGELQGIGLFTQFFTMEDQPYNAVDSFITQQEFCQDKHACDLLANLLRLGAKQRLTAEQALKHPFFSEIKKQQEKTLEEVV